MHSSFVSLTLQTLVEVVRAEQFEDEKAFGSWTREAGHAVPNGFSGDTPEH